MVIVVLSLDTLDVESLLMLESVTEETAAAAAASAIPRDGEIL